MENDSIYRQTVLISTQYDDNVSNETIRNDVMKLVVEEVVLLQ